MTGCLVGLGDHFEWEGPFGDCWIGVSHCKLPYSPKGQLAQLNLEPSQLTGHWPYGGVITVTSWATIEPKKHTHFILDS